MKTNSFLVFGSVKNVADLITGVFDSIGGNVASFLTSGFSFTIFAILYKKISAYSKFDMRKVVSTDH